MEINEYNGAMLPDAPECSPPRTTEEIAALKANWLNDPCYDIEDAEGFDFHYMELRRWREGWEEAKRQREEARVIARADHLGFSYTQMKFVENLEAQIRELQRTCATLRDSIENGH